MLIELASRRGSSLMRGLCHRLIVAILLMSAASAADAQTELVESAVADLPIVLATDPALTRPHVITPDEKKNSDEADAGGVILTYVFETKLRLRSERYFLVVCSSGGSADYNCVFNLIGGAGDLYQDQIEGLRFEIPGDGCVYASGHVNPMFDHRRKYCLDDDRLKEVNQPFHYVGLKSKTLHDLTFYFDKAATNAVGTIPKGEFVEVLVASDRREEDSSERYHFLVRDKNGLTGWVSLAGGQQAEDIEGIFFAGD
ncbi:hypothetical protein ABIB94_002230 [Bradyrhizobium sp. JR7.2]|uniref:SH3 domain-containing protein n=1 Tax=Bradyrhizobium sp. JR7.2 TaxID=3156375 RepID=UPI0033999CBE